DAERSDLRRRVTQLEHSLRAREQMAAGERNQYAADLNQMRQQLAEETKKRVQLQVLQQDRAQIQVRVQEIEQRWFAREAAIVQERALWHRYLEGFTVVATPLQPASTPKAAPAPSQPAARPAPKRPLRDSADSRRQAVLA